MYAVLGSYSLFVRELFVRELIVRELFVRELFVRKLFRISVYLYFSLTNSLVLYHCFHSK